MAMLLLPLRVCPGAPLGQSLVHARPDLAGTIASRTPLPALPRTLALAHNLCGHAHELASQLALRAAGADVPAPATAAASTALVRETFFEHTRRIVLDWPRLLAPALAPDAVAALHASPVRFMATPDWPAIRAWQAAWCAQGCGGLADAVAAKDIPLPPTPALTLQREPEALAGFARAVLADVALAAQPQWQGQPAHTGCWTRMGAQDLSTTTLLQARLAEWRALAEPGATLAFGALPLGAQAAVAWVEMARGLLLHVAELDDSRSRVLRYRIVAPTDWNVHPQGSLAQALTQPHTDADIARLMAAIDPCLPYTVAREANHA